MHEKKLGYISVPIVLLFFPNSSPDHCRFLCNDCSFLGRRFAGPDLADQVSEFQRHPSELYCWLWLTLVDGREDKPCTIYLLLVPLWWAPLSTTGEGIKRGRRSSQRARGGKHGPQCQTSCDQVIYASGSFLGTVVYFVFLLTRVTQGPAIEHSDIMWHFNTSERRIWSS